MRSQLGGKLPRRSDVSTQGSPCFTSAVRNAEKAPEQRRGLMSSVTPPGGRAPTHAVGSRCVHLLPTTLFLLPVTPETSFSCRNFFVVAPPVKTAAEEEDGTLSHHTAAPLLTATAGTPVSGHVGEASGPFCRLSTCRRSPPFCLQRCLNPDDGGTLRRVDAETEIKRRLTDTKRRSLENLDHDTNTEEKWNQTQGAVEVGCT